MNRWFKAKSKLPKSGSIVEIKVRKTSCPCGGNEIKECYFEDGKYFGIKERAYVEWWRLSEANELIKELELRKQVVAKDCAMCL